LSAEAVTTRRPSGLKAADVTTLHVMVGASALLTGALWWLAAARRTKLAA
jgi:hypothetical protein